MRLVSKGERGAALLLVLVLTAAISALLANLLVHVDSGAKFTKALELQLKQRVAINSAIEITAARLRDLNPQTVQSMTFQFGAVSTTVAVQREDRRTDLNAASPEELEAWLASHRQIDPDKATVLAHQIVDWRDPAGLRQLMGAEENDYRAAGRIYGPPDAPFRHMQELRDLLGMDNSLFQLLAKTATIATGDGSYAQAEDDDAESTDVDDARDNSLDNDSGFQTASVYRLAIQSRLASGSSYRSEAVIWIDPPALPGEQKLGRSYELLEFQPLIVDALSDSGEP